MFSLWDIHLRPLGILVLLDWVSWVLRICPLISSSHMHMYCHLSMQQRSGVDYDIHLPLPPCF